jgi:hypothetical protein
MPLLPLPTPQTTHITPAEKMPVNDYASYFAPEYSLNTTASNMVNLNTRAELEKTKIQIFEMLRELPHAPSTPIDHNVPPSAGGEDIKPEDEMDTDTRKESGFNYAALLPASHAINALLS